MTQRPTPDRTTLAERATLDARARYWLACAVQAPTPTNAAACRIHARQHRTYCPAI